jgi:hypothetical protein
MKYSKFFCILIFLKSIKWLTITALQFFTVQIYCTQLKVRYEIGGECYTWYDDAKTFTDEELYNTVDLFK